MEYISIICSSAEFQTGMVHWFLRKNVIFVNFSPDQDRIAQL